MPTARTAVSPNSSALASGLKVTIASTRTVHQWRNVKRLMATLKAPGLGRVASLRA